MKIEHDRIQLGREKLNGTGEIIGGIAGAKFLNE